MDGLREFTVGGALRQTFALIRRRAGTLLALGIILSALPILAFGLIPRFLIGIPTAASLRATAAAGGPPSSATALTLFGLGNTAVQLIGTTLVLMSVAWLADQRHRGRPARFGATVGAALRALPAAIAVMVLSSLAIGVGLILLLVPGVMLILRWAVAYPALVVERPGILGALGRSRDLTSGHRWAVLGFVLVVALLDLLLLAVGFGVGVVAALAGGGAFTQAAILVGGSAINAALAAFNGAAYASLYIELRRTREGAFSADTVEAFA